MSLDLSRLTRIKPGQTFRILPPEDFPMFYEYKLKLGQEPEHIPFLTEFARKYPLGSPQVKDALEKYTERLWLREVEQRHGTVESAEERVLTARHKDHSKDEVEVPGCLACVLAKRLSEGRPPAQKLWVTVLRDAEPLEMVRCPKTPKQHKRRRWMSEAYHRRIQKKWTKRVVGQTELCPKQERVIISMSMAMAKAIRDRFFHTPSLGDDLDEL